MATQLLATGAGQASSSDLTVSTGTPVPVALKAATVNAEVRVELKDDEGNYNPVGLVLTSVKPAVSITVAGVYRFTRINGTCGVYSG